MALCTVVALLSWMQVTESKVVPVAAFSSPQPPQRAFVGGIRHLHPASMATIRTRSTQRHPVLVVPWQPSLLFSSFAADGSEYAADQSDFDDDDEEDDGGVTAARSYRDDDDGESPTVELQPVPISKNSGNRFVAVVWDRQLQTDLTKDALDRHSDRIQLTEEHVMFCRKQNLYNETANAESAVDILWSLPMYVLFVCILLFCVFCLCFLFFLI